jgi:hypothetical protein
MVGYWFVFIGRRDEQRPIPLPTIILSFIYCSFNSKFGSKAKIATSYSIYP